MSGRTINPSKIVSVEDWAKAYKNAYNNIIMSPDGELWVMDKDKPVTEESEPVKTIPHLHGYDCLSVLNSKTVTEELRAAAETRLNRVNDQKKALVDAAKTKYTTAEDELLSAVDMWKASKTKENAELVAIANAKLENENKKMRELMYAVTESIKRRRNTEGILTKEEIKKRIILTYYNIPYTMITPGTKDESSIGVIYGWSPTRFDVKDRVLTVGGAGGAAGGAGADGTE